MNSIESKLFFLLIEKVLEIHFLLICNSVYR